MRFLRDFVNLVEVGSILNLAYRKFFVLYLVNVVFIL